MNALSLNTLGNEMRIVRSLVLAACLMFAPLAVSQAQKDKPAAEFNIAACGGQDFTVQHAVLNADRSKLSLEDYLVDAETVKKDDEPIVFDVRFDPKSDDGTTTFRGTAKLDNSVLTLVGATFGNRFVAIMAVNGNLGHLFYGFTGPLADITVGVQDSAQFCILLRGQDEGKLPGILADFLLHGAVNVPTDKS